MATVKDALLRLLDGLCSLPPRTSGKGPRVVIRRTGGSADDGHATAPQQQASTTAPAVVTIRVATFNAAMFATAPAVPSPAAAHGGAGDTARRSAGASSRRPQQKGILKLAQAPSPPPSPGKQLRVSINLQDGEITPEKSRRHLNGGGGWKGKAMAVDDAWAATSGGGSAERMTRPSTSAAGSVAEVLREVGADIVGLQNVRAEQERGLRPLSELAEGLGMRYVFAESWAPEYGNAVLSRWPIKRWKVHRVAAQSDFRNVLRVTVDVPGAGEVNFHCTHLEHLDEGLRMKQVNSILRSADGHHILAGGLNALDSTDYSADRWSDIVQYYAEISKPTPKTDVMRYLKSKGYIDAKDFAGECEAVVVVAKGQGVQGTCRYGTRVDYILASPSSPYKFVPGSYAVVSSKGTSDHHVVKADITVAYGTGGAQRRRRQRVVRMSKGSTEGIWAAR
ncbi:hypothetical protein ACP4OV_031922 [Aristida adscensionis]